MLAALSRSKGEILARAVRDLIADCSTTLPALVRSDAQASLHFFFANYSGMRKQLFPELAAAYRQWLAGGPIRALAHTAAAGAARWLDIAGQMLRLYERHGEQVEEAIIGLLEPLAARRSTAH
jgi:hypothetical protein